MVAVNDKKLFIGQGARLASVNRDVAVLVKIEFWNAEDLVEPNTMSSRKHSECADEKKEIGSRLL